MIARLLRDIVNLLIYGGFFIGLCAACITALSLELCGKVEHFLMYSFWIGVCTAALYCGHRVIGLQKVAHIKSNERFIVIRKYEYHIWTYFCVWIIIALVIFYYIGSIELLIWMIPGGFIAFGYVMPLLTGHRRFRDLGWGKIIMIGWSWAWLTAFVPLWFLAEEPLWLVILLTLERMLFIIAITIPFEIRDIQVDRSVGLMTLPDKFGNEGTKKLVWALCGSIAVISYIGAFHYANEPYFIAMFLISTLTVWVNYYSPKIQDDYFFGGFTDGLMVLALLLYMAFSMIA